MTIEAYLKRIAEALEALVQNQGIVPETIEGMELRADLKAEQATLALDDEDLSGLDDPDLGDGLDDDLGEETPAPPVRKKKKKKKKKGKQIGTDDVAESEYTADEVREKLQELQVATGSSAHPKSILKKHGASTFGQLPIGRYDQVVAEVDKLLE